jgi:hypothetical protein
MRHADKSTLTRRQRSIVVACLAGAAGVVLVLTYWLWQRPSAEEQLRAVDAAHAIPDEENAAQLYRELFQDDTRPSWDPMLLPQAVQAATLVRAWRSAEFPADAQWIEDCRPALDALLLASRKPRCWFPVSEDIRQRGRRSGRAYHGALLLLRAANNDLGEGRVEAGLEKLLGVLRVGEHFRDQFDPSDHQTGITIMVAGLKRLGELVVTGDVPPEWLARFEAALPPVDDMWREDFRREEEMTVLYLRQTQRGVARRLLYQVAHGLGPGTKAVKGYYRGQLTEFRVARILLELRRHRNEAGVWPASLDAIRRRVPPDTLLDPLTHAPFEYESTGSSFRLRTYSRGWITAP